MAWISGSWRRADTVSLSDSSSSRHSSHSDRWRSTRIRSELLTSPSMYDESSSRVPPCLNLSKKPNKFISYPYSSRRIQSPSSSLRSMRASLTRDLALLNLDFTVPMDTLIASAASL